MIWCVVVKVLSKFLLLSLKKGCFCGRKGLSVVCACSRSKE